VFADTTGSPTSSAASTADYNGVANAARNLVDYDDLRLFWATWSSRPSWASGSRHLRAYSGSTVSGYNVAAGVASLRWQCADARHITGPSAYDSQASIRSAGANFRTVLDFPAQFPSWRYRHDPLAELNRSNPEPILDTTNTLISRAALTFHQGAVSTKRTGRRKPPPLFTARDEDDQQLAMGYSIPDPGAAKLVRHALARDGGAFRGRVHVVGAGDRADNRKIPFEKWGGLRFLERRT